MFRGLPHQPDGVHLTPEGYHMLAEKLGWPSGRHASALRSSLLLRRRLRMLDQLTAFGRNDTSML
jgi:hypothetical protein